MRLEDKYDLLESVPGPERADDATIPAWEKSTGRLVFVHFLAGGFSPENSAVVSAVAGLAPENQAHILDKGDHDGRAFIVTDALPWGAPLRKWLQIVSGNAQSQPPLNPPVQFSKAGVWKVPVAKPEAAPAQRAEPAAAPEPGEFTRMIRAANLQPSPEPNRPVSASEAGEFTRLMQGAGTASTPPPPLETSLTPRPGRGEFGHTVYTSLPRDPAPPPAAEPGEFTRLMQAAAPPSAPPKPAPMAPVVRPAEPGEFTRILQARADTPTPAPPEPPPFSGSETITLVGSPQSAPPPTSGPGEFTRLMQADRTPPPKAPSTPSSGDMPWRRDMSAPPPPPPPPPFPSGTPGEFTRMMQGVKPEPPPSWQSSPGRSTPFEAPPPATSPTTGPGEFTSLFQTDRSSAPAPPPSSAPTAPGDLPWRHDMSSTPLPPAPASGSPGEFTRIFETRPPQPGPALPPMTGKTGPGEFTRMMSAPSAPSESLFKPPSASDTDIFGQRPGAAQSDEFSRVVSGPNLAPSQTPPKPIPPPAVAKPKSAILPIVLILVGLVVVAAVLVLVFARS